MITHELLVCVDDTFTGTISQVLDYLKLGQSYRNKISFLARTNQKYKGHKLKLVGILKHCVFYGVLDDKGIIIHKGTCEELSKILFKSPATIQNAAKGKFKLDSKYQVIKIGIVDRIEEYK